jgi:hypothetical protein
VRGNPRSGTSGRGFVKERSDPSESPPEGAKSTSELGESARACAWLTAELSIKNELTFLKNLFDVKKFSCPALDGHIFL